MSRNISPVLGKEGREHCPKCGAYCNKEPVELMPSGAYTWRVVCKNCGINTGEKEE